MQKKQVEKRKFIVTYLDILVALSRWIGGLVVGGVDREDRDTKTSDNDEV